MQKIIKFDNQKASIRILIMLLYNQTPTPKLRLIEHVKKLDVGKSAFYSSFNVLVQLGLVQEEPEIRAGKRLKLAKLTESGVELAEKLNEIFYLLKTD